VPAISFDYFFCHLCHLCILNFPCLVFELCATAMSLCADSFWGVSDITTGFQVLVTHMKKGLFHSLSLSLSLSLFFLSLSQQRLLESFLNFIWVEGTFEESTFNLLFSMSDFLPLILLFLVSPPSGRKECDDTIDFLKERVAVEEEYSKKLLKLAKSNDNKAGFGLEIGEDELNSTLRAAWKQVQSPLCLHSLLILLYSFRIRYFLIHFFFFFSSSESFLLNF